MEPPLVVCLLGSFELQHVRDRDGPRQALLLPPTLKSQSLLAYLVAFRHQPHTREHLAALFWGERPERRARRSLSTALWQIHHCLPRADLLLSNTTSIQFNPQTSLWLDVEAFEALAAQPDLASLRAAVDLYRGDFLDGFDDDWVVSERYRLESLLLDVLTRLMTIRETLGDHVGTLAAARQLLARDPLHEDAHRAVMRSLCHLGQRHAALSQYRICQQLLRQDLDAAPMTETQALYRAIVEGRFACAPGSEEMAAPVVTLTRPAQGRSPLDAAAFFPLVGREQELAYLHETWQAAQAGQCSLLLISGEAGMGKTRLVQEFASTRHWQGTPVLHGRCYEFERLLPYQPVAEALQTLPPDVTRAAITDVPAWVSVQVARLAPDPFGQPPGRFPAQGSEEQLFEGVSRFLARLASQEPLLLVCEDLHWASDSTLQLLHYLARHLLAQPLLLVGTVRPEVIAPALATLGRRLERDGLARRLALQPLSAAAVAALIEQLSGDALVTQPLADRLYLETEGNPFYLIQTLKTLFEQRAIRVETGVWQADFDALSRDPLPLPASVSETIAARVERLRSETQEAVQVAAVAGRAFDFDLLRAAWGQGEEATLAALDDLLRQRLIGETAADCDGHDYAFTHHKIQEVIYSRLARHHRQHLHRQVGLGLEQLLGAESGSRAAELAFHFEQAQKLGRTLADKAIAYLLQASQQAMQQSASQEAIAYVRRGLDIVRTLPATPARVRQEIDLQIALALPTTSIHGYASPEARRVYETARQLCQQYGDAHSLFTTRVGLGRYYAMAGDLATGVELVEQLMASAEAARSTSWLVEACRQKGGYIFAQGRLRDARTVLERGLALYDPAYHERHAYRFGHDPAVAILNYLNLTLWLLGYPAQAAARVHQLETLAQAMVQPTSQVIAQCMLAMSAVMRRDGEAALHLAQEGMRLSQLYGLSLWQGLATAFQGWALAEHGACDQGLAQLRDGTAAWRAMGTLHFTPFLLGLQAETALKAHELEVGRAALADGLAIAAGGGDTYWLAELHRLRGELLWAGGQDIDTVEACFREAQATARQQAARMLELRATVSLARLWQSQGQAPAARGMLADVYGQFDECFDSPDLLAAERLLRTL